MSQKYPIDRFDFIPSDIRRVGAHRSAKNAPKRGRAWLWAALAAVVLAGGGTWLLASAGDRVTNLLDPGTKPVPTPTIAPTIEATPLPKLLEITPVAILNGTENEGLELAAKKQLERLGIIVSSAETASDQSETETNIIYTSAETKRVADAIAEALGTTKTQLSTDELPTETDVLVILGTDYTGLTNPSTSPTSAAD